MARSIFLVLALSALASLAAAASPEPTLPSLESQIFAAGDGSCSLPADLLPVAPQPASGICWGPWECMNWCFERGCLTTTGCDVANDSCFCANCS